MTRANLRKVPKKQWNKWSDDARRVFNYVYTAMWDDPHLFVHTKGTIPSKSHWRVTCWNAAWIAADAHDRVNQVKKEQ